jgi:hypothetical protein
MPILFSGLPLKNLETQFKYQIQLCTKALNKSYLVTPPKDLSTINAVTLSLVSPVISSLTGVLAKTVKTSASPPFYLNFRLAFLNQTR